MDVILDSNVYVSDYRMENIAFKNLFDHLRRTGESLVLLRIVREEVIAQFARECGMHEDRAGMFYGNVWKNIIIDRDERWIGIRSEPTFPQRGISLAGKTYFLDINL